MWLELGLSYLVCFPLCWLHCQADFFHLGALESSRLMSSLELSVLVERELLFAFSPYKSSGIGSSWLKSLACHWGNPCGRWGGEMYIPSHESGDSSVYGSI